MYQYELLKCTTSEFRGLLVCLSSDSLYNYFDLLCNERLIKASKGKLLIDQLFITGNEKNRFISLNYDHGKIDFNSTTYNLPEDYYKQLSLNVFRNNINLIKDSILTEKIKTCILNNKIF